VVWRGR